MNSNAALKQKLIHHLSVIYPYEDHDKLADQVIATFWPQTGAKKAEEQRDLSRESWSAETSLVITYGDTFKKEGEEPLKTLQHFLEHYIKDHITGVHILPFFPYSSDDGFSVMDYTAVRDDLGDWDDIQAIGDQYQLMSDLVINHASSRGDWFQKFLAGDEDYKDFFVTASPDDDLSEVVRPRPSPLLTEYETNNGLEHIWCTFSADQVDLNFANPKVLLAFIDVMRIYLNNNVRILRLDAVAFLWKEVGTPCIHLPQTHEIVRLFRTIIDHYEEDAIIITETNVPNNENLSYFGNRNEAHLIYNFSLPPLLIQALLTGSDYYLKKWLMRMPPTQDGCAYLNFVAGHDGVGLRPASGILMDADFQEMIRTIRSFSGEISMRSVAGGEQQPYEMNISLFDALKGTIEGEDEFQRARFLASQTIMMALEGVPAFYIHSLLATTNDLEKFRSSGHKRCINRHQWDYKDLEAKLADPTSDQHYIFNELMRMLDIRKKQRCFHPNATQFTLHLPEGFFGFWRQSLDRKQETFCVTNLTKEEHELPLRHLHLHSGAEWMDLLSGHEIEDIDKEMILAPYQSIWLSNH